MSDRRRRDVPVPVERRTFHLGYDPDNPPIAVLIQRTVDAEARLRRAETAEDRAEAREFLAETQALLLARR